MTIIEAIEHAKEIASSGKCNSSCAKAHEQLAEWLEELVALRKENLDLKEKLKECQKNP